MTFILGTISLLSFGLFVCCVDRRQINYLLMERCVFIAAISNFMAIMATMKNISKIRENKPDYVGRFSWLLKKVFSFIFYVFMCAGMLIYLGQIDIIYKNIIEYCVVVSTYLFYCTFVLDFKHEKMEVDAI